MKSITVSTFTGGIIGPSVRMMGPVADGGTISVETAPGCWGPMITPKFKGGHEVTQPVAVAGACVGDAVAIRIREVSVKSLATSSGVMSFVEGRYQGDPFVAKVCSSCGERNPATKVEGIGQYAIHCQKCGSETGAFRMTHGYTIVFDHTRQIGITVGKDRAEEIARHAVEYAKLPSYSEQHSILIFGPADIPGVIARLRPFIGNIGTVPGIDMPDSHNAGDFGQFLVGAPHEYGISAEKLELRTDGHLDIDSVRPGAILICPVKVDGGGVYVGDMHAMQGDGEIAGHTTDVSGTAVLEVQVIKGLRLEGPVLLPPEEDLPLLARPLKKGERECAADLGAREHQVVEASAPIQVIGSGANLNDAVENGLSRTAKLLRVPVDEVKNRATITGGIEIGRLPGIVTVSMMVPLKKLKEMGLAEIVCRQYELQGF